jgi:YidC/Oxa1 family membrane protein insertase
VVAVVFLLISAFQYMAPPPRPARRAPPAGAPPPSAPTAPGAPALGAAAPTPAPEEEFPALETIHHLRGEGLDLGLSSHGGRVVQARLEHFLETRGTTKGQQAPKVDLASLKGAAGGHLRFSFEGWSPTASYNVVEETSTTLVFERESAGWRVRRSFRLDPTHFGLKTETSITNLGGESRTVQPWLELTQAVREDEKNQGSFFSGGAPIDQTTFLCADAQEVWREAAVNMKAPHQQQGQLTWAGMDQQYFLAGWVPREGQATGCAARHEGATARLSISLGSVTVAPSQTVRLTGDAFFGPKQEQWLTRVDAVLVGAVDYGWFGVIVRLLLMMLLWFYKLIPNYGAAIFLLTLFVKLITLPLTQKSFISMQRMKDLQPRIKEIQHKYAHDKAMQGQKQMELFKEEGVSPLGGCVPILVQMPVWIALYRTLYVSVELYQQPFIPGWIDDLAQKDPFYVTPLALGVVMLIQAVLTPQPEDNPQMKYVSYGMPIFFTFIMLALPAGLTLYMFYNSVLTIAQQLYIKRRFGTPSPAKKAAPAAATRR